MHEYSICEGLVGAVLDELRKHGLGAGSLRSARIAVGALHQVVPDSLAFAYELLTRGTPAAGSRLEIRHVPAAARCRGCGWEGELRVPVFLCGACQSGEVELLTGKELHLENLEIEQDDG